MDWNQYYINMLSSISAKSKDRSKKVGCIIVGPGNEIRSTGYNNFPRGINDNIDDRYNRPLKYKFTEHAERNAIYNAARMGTPLLGCRAYIDWFPCTDCARGLINSGISEVIVDYRDSNPWKADGSRWAEDIEISLTMLTEAGIEVVKYG